MISNIKHLIISLTKEEKIYLLFSLGLYIGYSIFHIFYFPIYIDETETFLYFTSKGFLTSATYYPYPNNHIFFSLISNLFTYLPFDPLICLRLPNLLFGIISSILIYGFIRSKYGHKIAVIPHLFFTFSYFIAFYSVFARGYMLIILVTIICFICIEKLKNSFESKYLICYSIFSVIGFYTIPVFLYVSVSFILYLGTLFLNDKYKLLQLIKYHIIIAIVTFLLYCPIIYYNGIDAIINNQWTKKIDFNEIISFFKTNAIGMYDKILGVNSLYILIIYFLYIIFLLKKKYENSLIYFILIFFTLPFIFILVQHVIPGTRTWSYLIVPFVIGITLIFSWVLKFVKLNKFFIYSIGLFIILIQMLIFLKSHPKAALEKDFIASKLSIDLQNKGYSIYYFEKGYTSFDKVNIEFQNLRMNKYVVLYDYKKSPSINEFKKVNCFLLNKNSKIINSIELQNFKLEYEDDYMMVYGKINFKK